MTYIWLLLIAFIILFTSCSKGKQSSEKLEFPLFQIQVPDTWRTVTLQEIDTYVSGILTDRNDTIAVQIANLEKPENFFEESMEVRPLERKALYDSIGFKYPQSMIFSTTVEVDEKQAIHLKQYYFQDTISRKVAKVGLPKRIGQGITFVQFREIGPHKEDVMIYGTDLDTATQFLLYRAFQTITFIEPTK